MGQDFISLLTRRRVIMIVNIVPIANRLSDVKVKS